MFAVERRRRTICIDILQLAMPPDIPAFLHVDFVSCAAKNNHMFNGCVATQCVIDIFFQRHNSTAPICAIGRDQSDGAAVSDSVANAVRTKSAKDDRMHRTDACAGQHRDCGLGNIWQINDHAIALLDLVPFQHIREAANFVMQLLVSERALIARFALPENRRFIPARAG